jgi:iron complex transport system substrate-binding protein
VSDGQPGRAFGREGGEMPRWSRPLGVLLVALIVVSCAGGEPQSRSASPRPQEEGFPVTVMAANGEVRIESRPQRIVSLSPSATEMLFAVGAGDQVVAVDDNSDYPPDAPITDLSGFEPNAEAVAEFKPDLVVVSDDLNDIVSSLNAVGIPVLHQPAAQNLGDTYTEIEQLGMATGHVAEAEEVVASMRSEMERLTASLPEFGEPPTYYHELDQTFFSVTSATFIGQIYSLAGLENVADAATKGGPYPQLSAEFIIDADPDLIFLSDTRCCGVTAEKVARRPGWSQITAVRSGGVVELDDDIASRWGPRVVDFLRVVVREVSELQPATG